MPEVAEASEIVDSTHAQPAAAAAALGSALHDVRLVQSSSEVPELPSRGWHDALKLLPVESDQRVESAVAAGPANLVRDKSRPGLKISVAAVAAEPQAVNLNHSP